jgi:tetratricopeptide (TPR) repeat protein
VTGWLAVWSNHFESSFHFNDFPAIVSNLTAQHLSNVPRFFSDPRISSLNKDSADYRPLLSTWFAFDYQFLGGAKPFTFQAENFAWFTAVLVVMFAFFRLLPGVNTLAAGFATMLFGLHPVVADTVNYALQRGVLMASFGVIAGMLIFVYWPWHLPQTLPIKLKRVPEHGLDEYLRHNYRILEARYLRLIHLPLGIYLWPVIPALLCDASTAVFAPILIVYVMLFETKRNLRHTIPAIVLCAGYWIFQLVFTWNLHSVSATPAFNYWFTEPWVVLRCLFRFLVPVHLSADTDLSAFAHFLDPLAIAGCLGLGALVYVAVLAARSEKWRTEAFGIWWFLITLAPDAIVPHRVVEADWRMFLPFVGLALVVARAVSILLDAAGIISPEASAVRTSAGAGDTPSGAAVAAQEATAASNRRFMISVAGATAGVGLLSLLGWMTHERNADWQSERTLWQSTMEASPKNGRAVMYYGLTRQNDRDLLAPLNYMKTADALSPRDPLIEINFATAYARLGRNGEAESEFRRATTDGLSYAPAWSAYGQWLLNENRIDDGFARATQAVALDAYDLTGRRVLMDVMGQKHQWAMLKQLAEETLRLFPNDPDGERSELVAQTGIDSLSKAASAAVAQPTANNYLKLSVLYYETGRYDDCINAARGALKINPELGEAYANIASAYHTMGKLDETIAALEQEVRLNPNLPSAKSNLQIELAVKAQQHKNVN